MIKGSHNHHQLTQKRILQPTLNNMKRENREAYLELVIGLDKPSSIQLADFLPKEIKSSLPQCGFCISDGAEDISHRLKVISISSFKAF